ncbi:transposase [Aeoliella sp. ICT_H6.2]|uniref:Transposase n=2 Tax=Aeoliella straminimaris TaxID=2954799 RepID=A0A9X2F837_9BACT|nr:transposase [Aeoliella straminimaris]MCO6044090.1 transposase [Aeoliella straminimaris]
MPKRQIYDQEQHAQFVTFSCYHRRRLLDCEPLRDALIESLAEKITKYSGICSGYVIVPDHVHAIVWFEAKGELSRFMKSWRQSTSQELKRMLRGVAPEYAKIIPPADLLWQPRYHPFNVYSQKKAEEKLDYMHKNPVTAGLVERAVDWKWSSARHYLLNEPNVVPLEWIF